VGPPSPQAERVPHLPKPTRSPSPQAERVPHHPKPSGSPISPSRAGPRLPRPPPSSRQAPPAQGRAGAAAAAGSWHGQRRLCQPAAPLRRSSRTAPRFAAFARCGSIRPQDQPRVRPWRVPRAVPGTGSHRFSVTGDTAGVTASPGKGPTPAPRHQELPRTQPWVGGTGKPLAPSKVWGDRGVQAAARGAPPRHLHPRARPEGSGDPGEGASPRAGGPAVAFTSPGEVTGPAAPRFFPGPALPPPLLLPLVLPRLNLTEFGESGRGRHFSGLDAPPPLPAPFTRVSAFSLCPFTPR